MKSDPVVGAALEVASEAVPGNGFASPADERRRRAHTVYPLLTYGNAAHARRADHARSDPRQHLRTRPSSFLIVEPPFGGLGRARGGNQAPWSVGASSSGPWVASRGAF